MREKIRIYVLSKNQFETMLVANSITDKNVEIKKDMCFISIIDKSVGFFGIPYFKENHSNVLNLQFDDVEKDGESSTTNKYVTKAFTKEDGQQIIDFLNKNKKCNKLIIHCAAGISRSGAVGDFALAYLDGDVKHFNIKNSHIYPNAHVRRTLFNLVNGYTNE